VNKANKDGYTPMHVSFTRGKDACALMLKDAGGI